jgi:hypothetical protein
MEVFVMDLSLATRRSFLGVMLLAPVQAGCTKRTSEGTVEIAGISFRILRSGSPRRHFIHIHGNEDTAREVLGLHMRTSDGVAFFVQNSVRNARVHGAKLDPNRMFSRIGAEQNLIRLNPSLSESRRKKVLDSLDADREAFVKQLFPSGGTLLVALHNNSEGYSVEDERPISDAESIPRPREPRNFMICTDRRDFEILKTSPFNVVLQSEAPPNDDGSLSRLAAARGIRYVNIEAAMGDASGQKEMLVWIEDKLPVTF